MESQNINIYCPIHKGEEVTKIDLDVRNKIHLYCSECQLNSPNLEELNKSLSFLSDFFEELSKYYIQCQENDSKTNIPFSDVEAIKAISQSRDESVEMIENQIIEEKERISDIFNEIKSALFEIIERKKELVFNILDKQCFKYKKLFLSLASKIEQIETKITSKHFPTIPEILEKLSKASEKELNEYITSLKNDLYISRKCNEENIAPHKLNTEMLIVNEIEKAKIKKINMKTGIEFIDLKMEFDDKLDFCLNQLLKLNNEVLDPSAYDMPIKIPVRLDSGYYLSEIELSNCDIRSDDSKCEGGCTSDNLLIKSESDEKVWSIKCKTPSFIITFDHPRHVKMYGIKCLEEESDCDPQTWEVYGLIEGKGERFLVHKVENIRFEQRNLFKNFYLEIAVQVKELIFIFYKTNGSGTLTGCENGLKISEISFYEYASNES